MTDILETFGEFEGDAVLNENRHHLEPEELARLFKVFRQKSPLFWHPFFFLMYQFGCRVSEVRIIKKESFCLERKEIVIYRLKKRQWDRRHTKSTEEFVALVKKKHPEATSKNDTVWSVGGDPVARLGLWRKDKFYDSQFKNNTKGIKRFLYKIDDNTHKVLSRILEYNKLNGKSRNHFLFPAFIKRKSKNKKKSARMVQIGRIKGDHCVSRTVCWKAFREACKVSNIPESLRKDHVLRHTRATLLLADGKPEEQVQYLLGHESISTTRGYLGLANALMAKYQANLDDETSRDLLAI